MEFRCRLGTPGGEIIEGVYIADSEARLRRELEEKGLYVLSLQRRGGLSGLFALAGRAPASQPPGVPGLQPGAGDAAQGRACRWCSRSTSSASACRTPRSRPCSTTSTSKVRAGTALSDAFVGARRLFPAVYSASLMAGERSGNLDSVIRRYVAYEKVIGAVRRRTISALIYPAILVTMMAILIGIIVLRVVPAFSDFYANFDRPAAAARPGSSSACRTRWSSNILVMSGGRRSSVRVAVVLVCAAAVADGPASTVAAQGAVGRGNRSKFSTAQLARMLCDAAGRRHSAGQRARDCCPIDVEPISERMSSGRGTPARPGRAELCGGAARARRSFRTWR